MTSSAETHGAERHTPRHQAGERNEAWQVTRFETPLVSVIVVNYNYGRYLADAISSVFAQNYKNIECFVVDNKSTDDSLAVLDELSVAYPELRVVRRASNDGQCVATAEVFPETRGQYVVFLDADDVLLPDFVGTHVFVNLSLYTHVGFTCSDMVQAVDRDIVLTTFHSIKDLIKAKDHAERMLRPVEASICSLDGLTPVPDDAVLLVARDCKGWPWTATSAFMFRRDAIAMLIENPRLHTLRSALDVYFARGINAMTGSVVIDRALAVYRMHGSNAFSHHAHLERCFNFERGSLFDQNEKARRVLIDFWFLNARFLIEKFLDLDDFIEGVRALNDTYPRLTASGGRSYAAAQFLQAFGELRKIVGRPKLVAWGLRLRLSPLALAMAFLRG